MASTQVNRKPPSAGEEKRKLVRVNTGSTRDLNADLTLGKHFCKCRVEDFHFQSIRLSSPAIEEIFNLEAQSDLKVKNLRIFYGRRKIGECSNPLVIRKTQDNQLILNLSNSDDNRGQRSKSRIYVKPSFRPVIVAKDPIRIDTILNFDLLNFSGGGMLLDSSLSNRHILKGYQFDDAQLLLPGIGIITLSFQAHHVSFENGRMRLGVAFTKITTQAMEQFAQFALFGTLPPSEGTIEKKYMEVKASIGPIRNLGGAIRVDVVSRPVDYYNVLRVRFEAYRQANKLDDKASIEDMADIYDLHSIILVAKADNAVVGTVRMVECIDKNDQFPLEKHFDFKNIDKESVRKSYYEVSRLAVDPKFQGTDIIVKMFKEVARITCINPEMTTICMTTKVLARMYSRMGFFKISGEVKHPILAGETLSVMKVNSEEFLLGTRMPALAWDRIAKDVLENLRFAEATKIKPNKTKMNLKMKIEKLLLGVSKVRRLKRDRKS